MRIVSQDKERDYCYDNSNVYIANYAYPTTDYDICISSPATGHSEELGTYSTKEKALKVMKMLRENYLTSNLTSIGGSSFLEKMCNKKMEKAFDIAVECFVFQMPQDSEVEA